jgi:predicted DNA-binding transcriptional regulator AlpA
MAKTGDSSNVPPLIRAAELARRLGIARSTINGWEERAPSFPARYALTTRAVSYDLAEVKTWLASPKRTRREQTTP